MKIGIITFNFAPNSGAMLQCWALQEKLLELRHDVYVLDYRPQYHTSRYQILKNPFSLSAGSLLNRAKIVYYNRNALIRYFRMKKYKQFEKNLNTTQVVKKDENWEQINIQSFDAIICGSDQVWNTIITNGDFDKVYFANLPNYSGRKIAYAASSGETDLNAKAQELIKLLKDFCAISIREHGAAQILSDVTGFRVECVPDPTLLITVNSYISIQKNVKTPQHYILIYVFGHDDLLCKTIESYAKNTTYTIISISPYRLTSKIKYKWDKAVGPGEFLSYISNADFIITNSFHCSVFSVLFHKKFCTIQHSTRNERIENLMNIVGINNTIIHNEQEIAPSFINEIDYRAVDEKLKYQRLYGTRFLENALNVKDR